jgi:DNA polymerase III epsilon subunit-like protein
MYLVFDLETSGLPDMNGGFPDAEDVMKYENSRVIEIGYIIMNDKLEPIHTSTSLVNSVEEVSNTWIHGITLEMIKDNGKSVKDMLKKMKDDLIKYEVQVLIAHNIKFDYNVLMSEVHRVMEESKTRSSKVEMSGLRGQLQSLLKECTMQEGRKLLGKNPKLKDLYEMLTGKNVIQTHRALDDVELCLECYKKLKEKSINI